MLTSPRIATAVCVAALVLSACAAGGDPADEVAASEPTEVAAAPSEAAEDEPDDEASDRADDDGSQAPDEQPDPEPEPTQDAEAAPSAAPQPASDPCDARGPQSFTTSVGDFFFDPADRADLCVGDRITFTNGGEISHTATNRGGAFDTGTLSAGQSATITLGQAGEIRYVCLFHSQMSGTLDVVG